MKMYGTLALTAGEWSASCPGSFISPRKEPWKCDNNLVKKFLASYGRRRLISMKMWNVMSCSRVVLY
jgi:hypothetical protein